MNARWLGCLSLVILQTNAFAATDQWTGGYVGLIAGGAYSSFSPQTMTQAQPWLSQPVANTINQVGRQTINAAGFLNGIEGGYNWQFNRLVFGLETDLSSASTNGSTTTGAVNNTLYPDGQLVINSYASSNWLFTARPRIGVVVNNWLLFATGGLGLTVLQTDFMFTDNHEAFESKRVNQLKAGMVFGAGFETGLTNYLSLKAEYRLLYFNNTSADSMCEHDIHGQTFLNAVSLRTSLIQVGINYHFNEKSFANLFDETLWQTEFGVRAFLSDGMTGAPQPLLNNTGSVLVSRLIYGDMQAISEEAFLRIDHATGIFVKGNLGAGSITHGQLNDEDFPAGNAYSNTSSDLQGNLSYATVDLGYSFLKTVAAKTGAFVGLQYYAQNIGAYGCTQMAGSDVCVPTNDFNNVLGIKEEDTYRSIRLGFNSVLQLTELLSLNAEAAYVPLVDFRGLDNHNLRELVGPEFSSYGTGTMLEAILGYQFAPSWNVGIGARYWAWNMREGTVTFDFQGDPQNFTQSGRYNAERYGVFLQLSYKNKENTNLNLFTSANDWRGFYVGGFLGGAFSDTRWHDPFNSTVSDLGGMNIAGFGDKVHTTGPVGGLDVHYNWQRDKWVYGLGVNVSALDMRGENTLFSGLGGINGQVINNYLGRFVGRFGTTYLRSLFYLDAGVAMLNTKYALNGNTSILNLGAQNKTINNWGYTAGIGVEYALTDHFTSNVEYDYIAIPNHSIYFGDISMLNNSRIAVDQQMNVFKLGFNYKI